ncbi:unnamed protein product [Arabidopsis lyrata]|uniref:Uncharacterized protein n=1 Tax=Arabidopsis lyrata subsp. lyrata TaxID=81972 RepID=D7LTQ6_ARALL|nr:uncharacterized protein LOC9314583 [Arabidopsis lyrata subsp. lyrata]EFH54774.1 hypothetical protein ARALYDRAFT_324763 [Arabidopsis lyrata subsp. lyrata]CAH8269602.1 unnamed protein product [Arabidopsis lyrata]|eukprot:XP_002878515.1 uncharacterized protein LOC9314583 [Arabidopsis lyrata subsp. lyrata]
MMDDDDYSAAATTVVFERPIPLLRGPVPSGGSYVLAFRSLDSWSAAFKRCETLIKDQCQEGARIGCAVSASNNCKPPWWRGSGDMRERDKCEEREFQACVAASKGKCAAFAKDKCSGAFLDARISKEVEGMVCLASMPEHSRWRDLMGIGSLHLHTNNCCTARDLLLNHHHKP